MKQMENFKEVKNILKFGLAVNKGKDGKDGKDGSEITNAHIGPSFEITSDISNL